MTAQPMTRPAAVGAPKSPYRGIEEFRYVDAPIFFGRDMEAERLLRLVTIYRGVLLYGDPGVGKSSFVNAKVMPLAVEEGYSPERVRVQPVKGAEFVVERIAPSEEPDVYLPSLFGEEKSLPRLGVATEDFLATLRENCRIGSSAAGPYPLIVFDQFEELVTLTEQASRRDANSVKQAYGRIVDTLLQILRDDTLRVKLLFVFREDCYAKLTRFFALWPTIIDNYLRLEPLHRSQLDNIISGPLRVAKFDHQLPAEVTELLELELGERGDLLILSEVQIACLRLWLAEEPLKILKTQHVSGLLETYFSEAIEQLPEALQEAATALLAELVTDSGTRNVVSEDTLRNTLKDDHGIPIDTTNRALEALEKRARVIRRESRNDVEVYEIVSEFLVPWIMRRKLEALSKKEFESRMAKRWRTVRWVFAAMGTAMIVLIAGIIYREMTRSRNALITFNERLSSENIRLGQDLKSQTLMTAESTRRHEVTRSALREVQLRAQELATSLANTIKERDDAISQRKTVEQTLKGRKDLENASEGEKAQLLIRAKDLESEVNTLKPERDQLKTERDTLTNERDSLRALLANEAWHSKALGITVQQITPGLREQFRIPERMLGVVVTLSEGGAKDDLGNAVTFIPGDVIVKIGDKAFDEFSDFVDVAEDFKQGQVVDVHVSHQRSRMGIAIYKVQIQ